jgi:hypothetical protein
MPEEKDKRSENIEALRVMADGAEDSSSDAGKRGGAEGANTQSERASVRKKDPAISELAEAKVSTKSPAAPGRRGTRTAARQNPTPRTRTHQYKRTMVPLLLVVALALLALSGVTLFLLTTASDPDPDHLEIKRTLLLKYGKWAVLVALPLAGMLLLGSWVFHRDVSQSKK